jgi:glutathione S-transferase
MQRYAAKVAGFYPSDPLEALTADEAMHFLNIMTDDSPALRRAQTTRKSCEKNLRTDPSQKSYRFWKKRIQDTGDSKGFEKSGTTVANVVLMATVKSLEPGILDYISTDFFKGYPGISAAGNENVAAYF